MFLHIFATHDFEGVLLFCFIRRVFLREKAVEGFLLRECPNTPLRSTMHITLCLVAKYSTIHYLAKLATSHEEFCNPNQGDNSYHIKPAIEEDTFVQLIKKQNDAEHAMPDPQNRYSALRSIPKNPN
jgi:hypothetical protein